MKSGSRPPPARDPKRGGPSRVASAVRPPHPAAGREPEAELAVEDRERVQPLDRLVVVEAGRKRWELPDPEQPGDEDDRGGCDGVAAAAPRRRAARDRQPAGLAAPSAAARSER